MTRHPNDHRTPTLAAQRARERELRAGASRVVRDVSAPGGVRVELDVAVDEIDEAAVDIHEDLPKAWVSALLDDGKPVRFTARDDARLDLRLEREAVMVRATGQAQFRLSHPCVRCLNDVPFDVGLKIDLRLVERAEEPPEADLSAGNGDGDDFEGRFVADAADIEDLNVASYSGGVVKVAELLREQLFLELPMHPACNSPNARPTAPCGFDKEGAVAIAQENARWVDPRWAGLQALRDKLAGGTGAAGNDDAPSAKPKKPTPQAVAKKAPLEPEIVVEDAVPLPGRDSEPIALPGPRAASLQLDDAAPWIAQLAKPAPKKKPAAKKKQPARKPAAKKSAKKAPAKKKTTVKKKPTTTAKKKPTTTKKKKKTKKS